MSSSSFDVLRKQNDLLDLVRKEPTHRNYWNVYNKIKRLDFSSAKISPFERIKIALMSSFTIDPLAIYLDIDCRLEGLFPEIYISPFNRYHEETLDEHSGLYKFQPDIIFFFVQIESLLDEKFRYEFPQMKTEYKKAEMDRIFNDITILLNTIKQRTDTLVVFSNFVIPTFSPFGILDNKQKIGVKHFYQSINMKLEESLKTDKQAFIFDLNEVASNFGKDKYSNFPMFYRGSVLFSEAFLSQLSYELMGYLKALKSRNRKCIVLDLDNTLWGGIIGEDEIEGIKLNVNYPGNEFVDFQRSILALHSKGIILAINSKNNLEDAREVFQNHPHMLIKEKNLAAYRINWNDKVKNLVELSKEMNIGLDSMVFIDDNPVERAHVQSSLPTVLVIEMPSNPALFRKFLEKLNDFNTLSLSEEDLHRGEMYYARRKRQHLEQQVHSIEEFIKSLNIVAKIRHADELVLPRVTSLLNRTNQFNLTTKRYTEAEVRRLYSDNKNFLIYTLEVLDKYGNEGIVGVAIVKIISTESCQIDCFLMSCRVIGRQIETSFLYKIIKDLQTKRVKVLEAEFIPTRKNSLVKDFYSKHDFKLIEKRNDGYSRWVLNLLDFKVIYPEYIQIVDE